MPSVYRLYSLRAIYALDMAEVLSWYGISMAILAQRHADVIQHTRTHPVSFQPEEGEIQVPSRSTRDSILPGPSFSAG